MTPEPQSHHRRVFTRPPHPRPDRRTDRVRSSTAFDSADPGELMRRLDASDCFCRDTKVGRMYHPSEVSFREITARDSLHVTFQGDGTVSTHVDRHSPLARRQRNGTCRYSPLRIVAHNITGALNDLLRLTIGRRPSTADYLVEQLVDDRAVNDTVTVKEVDRTGRAEAAGVEAGHPVGPAEEVDTSSGASPSHS